LSLLGVWPLVRLNACQWIFLSKNMVQRTNNVKRKIVQRTKVYSAKKNMRINDIHAWTRGKYAVIQL